MVDNKEIVSVIVPVHNIEDYLPRCLESISRQSFRNLEIILVDDGSTDNSGRICDAFAAKEARAKVIHQQNRGLWAARNAGQEASTGDYLFFPDGDDYFHYDMIRLMYEAINLDPQYDLAICREKQTWNTDEDITSRVDPCIMEKTGEDILRDLLESRDERFFVYMWNKLYRRRLIQDIRSRDYIRSQDYDANIRIFLHVNKAVLINNDLYYWLQHSGQLTKQQESVGMMYMCRTRSIYNNIQELPEEQSKYRPLLLLRLYKVMVFWKTWSLGRDNQKEIDLECGEYESSTRKSFFACKEIRLSRKVGLLFLLHSPHFSRFLMRRTRNL